MSSARTIREIEIKLPVADLPALVRRLHRMGVQCHGRVFERNTLYDTPDSDLRRRGYLLRLRIETPAGSSLVAAGPPSARLTYKAPPASTSESRYKERLERELAIGRPDRPDCSDRWADTLRKLGFQPGFHCEKYRTSFRLFALHMDLDETPVGNFLELEGIPAAIERAAGALGYAYRDYLNATYWELYAADCNRKGRMVANMVFGT